MWLPEDTTAAIEWQEYKDSLCVGCGTPRDESFAPENEGRYEAVALKCFKCATRESKAHAVHDSRGPDTPPPVGVYFAVTGPNDDD